MVTASHNENGWTGVKMPPLTFGPDEMGRLRDIVLGGKVVERDGGKLIRVEGEVERFIAACGNGTAGASAVDALQRMGVSEEIGIDTELGYTFPKYNPNPEDVEMLHSMAAAVREHGADLAFGFDGDGVRVRVRVRVRPLH